MPYGTKYEIADIDTFPDVRYDENSSESTGTISGSKEVVLNCFTQYQIIFNGNGSTIGYMSPRSSWYDSPIVLPNNQFQKTGYIFDGWNTEPDGSGVYYACLLYTSISHVREIALFINVCHTVGRK